MIGHTCNDDVPVRTSCSCLISSSEIHDALDAKQSVMHVHWAVNATSDHRAGMRDLRTFASRSRCHRCIAALVRHNILGVS